MSIAAPGLGELARRGLGTLGEMSLTRLELAGAELSLARETLVTRLLWGALAVLLLALTWALVLALLWWWAEPGQRGLVLGLGCLCTAAAAATAGWRMRRLGRDEQPLLANTQATLRADLDALRGVERV